MWRPALSLPKGISDTEKYRNILFASFGAPSKAWQNLQTERCLSHEMTVDE
jgi:hypothetical protein